MLDNSASHRNRLRAHPHLAGHGVHTSSGDDGGEGSEASCAAFGYLRGIRERADAVEFRFRDGNSVWFPYSWLGNWWFNPSEGVLLKFSGDLVYLVLIRGSNLDKPLKTMAIDLLHAGLQRHRVIWIREMNDEEKATIGESEPTIDSINVVEFESNAALKEWLGQTAPAFLH